MEFAIPFIALSGLYVINNNFTEKKKKENYENRSETGIYENRYLPNTDIPNKNYPEEYPNTVSPETDLTSQLSTVNKFYAPQGVYTDKYFKKNDNVFMQDGNQKTMTLDGSTAPSKIANYTSLSGETVDYSYYSHNNMTPFFGSNIRSNHREANTNEGVLDSMNGQGSQYITKKEVNPLFSPSDNMQYAQGMPNQSDFIQSRINPSLKMDGYKPFEDKHVAPGLMGLIRVLWIEKIGFQKPRTS
jgi:hypothetical protein